MPDTAPDTIDVDQNPDLTTSDLVVKRGAALVPRPKKFNDGDAGRRIRRGLPIHGYFGRNGHGKSMAMVHDTLPDLFRGDPVLSTVALLDAETGDPYPNYTRLVDWDQVIDFAARGEGAILFDEIIGVAGAREGMSLPVQVQNLLVQLRRSDISLRWTAPGWGRADKIIRETSQGATLCRGYLAKTVFSESGRELTWKQRRMFRFKTFMAEDFDEWSASKEKGDQKTRLKAVAKSWFWAPGRRAPWSYDTYDDVSRIRLSVEGGRCASCGGRQVAPECNCTDYVERKASHKSGHRTSSSSQPLLSSRSSSLSAIADVSPAAAH